MNQEDDENDEINENFKISKFCFTRCRFDTGLIVNDTNFFNFIVSVKIKHICNNVLNE